MTLFGDEVQQSVALSCMHNCFNNLFLTRFICVR